MAKQKFDSSKSRLQVTLEASAKRRGLDLTTQAGMRQTITALLPPHKQPLTHSPFAALANR